MRSGVLKESGVAGSAALAGRVPDDRQLRPVDWFTVGYLALTLLLLLANPSGIPGTSGLVALHVAGILAILVTRKSPFSKTMAGQFVLGFYPIVLFSFLYLEVGTLNRLIHSGTLFDSNIQAIEQSVFGGQPSRELHLRFPSLALGEYLHLGYLSYYLLAPAIAVVLWFKRPRYQFDTAIACITLSFYVSFVLFILIPVAGPYHEFVPPPPESVGYATPHMVRWFLDRGSAVGTAFPSSHTSVAITVWIMALRYHRGLALLYLFLVPALAAGAIYGGYHYAINIVAGAFLGVLIGTLGHRLTTTLAPRFGR